MISTRDILENPGYREKKVLATGTVIYVYSKGMLRHRHKQKAQRLERMRQEIPAIAAQVMRDLAGGGSRHKLALAVAVMAETFERVGGEESAKENGHYGITTMQVRHIRFLSGHAVIDYVAKSGVKQHKVIIKPSVVAALQRACSGKSSLSKVIEVTAPEVNDYLREFGITAKDIRGFFANETMAGKLRGARDRGPALPPISGARSRLLAAEFQECLVATAREIGHTTSILKKDYLVPRMVARYLLDGTVVEKLAKLPRAERAAEANVITAVRPRRANPAPAPTQAKGFTLQVFAGMRLLGTYAFDARPGLTAIALARQGLRMRGADMFAVQRGNEPARWYRAGVVSGVRNVIPAPRQMSQIRRNPDVADYTYGRGSAFYALRGETVVRVPAVEAGDILLHKPSKSERNRPYHGFTALFHVPAEVEKLREGPFRIQMGEMTPVWTHRTGAQQGGFKGRY